MMISATDYATSTLAGFFQLLVVAGTISLLIAVNGTPNGAAPTFDWSVPSLSEMKDDGVIKPDLFIEKPVDPEDVVEKVRELIGD